MSSIIPYNRKNYDLPNIYDGFFNVFNDFLNDDGSFRRNTFKVDVEDKGNEYCVEAELPGVKKEDIFLEIDDGRLNIQVKKEESINEEKKNYIHRERRVSSMSRSIILEGAKSHDVKAKLKDGLLTINIPKEIDNNKTTKINIE
jgi:HSP20 family protein